MKTWQQKFDNGKLPQVKVIDKPFGGFPAGTPMYISTPAEIDQFINQLKFGESLSVAEMRDQGERMSLINVNFHKLLTAR